MFVPACELRQANYACEQDYFLYADVLNLPTSALKKMMKKNFTDSPSFFLAFLVSLLSSSSESSDDEEYRFLRFFFLFNPGSSLISSF